MELAWNSSLPLAGDCIMYLSLNFFKCNNNVMTAVGLSLFSCLPPTTSIW